MLVEGVVNPDWIYTYLFTKLRQQHMLNEKQFY